MKTEICKNAAEKYRRKALKHITLGNFYLCELCAILGVLCDTILVTKICVRRNKNTFSKICVLIILDINKYYNLQHIVSGENKNI
jgi:hypothetical protein